MFGLLDHVKTARHRARALAIRQSAEVAAYLPAETVDLPIAESLPKGTQARLATITQHVRAGEYDQAASLVETSYRQMRLVEPGFYEFECLAAPLLDIINSALRVEEIEPCLADMLQWASQSPQSVYASACYAVACLKAGFVYRGTSWKDTIAPEALVKLDEFSARARLELDRTEHMHAGHWFWARADLQLAILDVTDRSNHWARFERASVAAPGASELYTLFAHQLMPRWHGNYAQLGKLCERALMHEDELTGLHNYVHILKTLLAAEGEATHVLFQPTPLNVLAQHYAARANDGDRTLATNLYSWADNWPKVLSTMRNVKTFHAHRWMCINSLEYTIAYALVGLPSDERQRA